MLNLSTFYLISFLFSSAQARKLHNLSDVLTQGKEVHQQKPKCVFLWIYLPADS